VVRKGRDRRRPNPRVFFFFFLAMEQNPHKARCLHPTVYTNDPEKGRNAAFGARCKRKPDQPARSISYIPCEGINLQEHSWVIRGGFRVLAIFRVRYTFSAV